MFDEALADRVLSAMGTDDAKTLAIKWHDVEVFFTWSAALHTRTVESTPCSGWA